MNARKRTFLFVGLAGAAILGAVIVWLLSPQVCNSGMCRIKVSVLANCTNITAPSEVEVVGSRNIQWELEVTDAGQGPAPVEFDHVKGGIVFTAKHGLGLPPTDEFVITGTAPQRVTMHDRNTIAGRYPYVINLKTTGGTPTFCSKDPTIANRGANQ